MPRERYHKVWSRGYTSGIEAASSALSGILSDGGVVARDEWGHLVIRNGQKTRVISSSVMAPEVKMVLDR